MGGELGSPPAGANLKTLAKMAMFPWRLRARTAKGLPPPVFSAQEVSLLLKYFTTYCEESPLTEESFLHFLHSAFKLTDDVMMRRVFSVLDRDGDGHVTFAEWLEGMATVLRRDLTKKAALCFQVYDLNQDGFITSDELQLLLKDSYHQVSSSVEVDDMVSDLIEITMKNMDLDHDGRFSLEDFQKSVEMEPLLLEAFGHCLPDQVVINNFMSNVMKNTENVK